MMITTMYIHLIVDKQKNWMNQLFGQRKNIFGYCTTHDSGIKSLTSKHSNWLIDWLTQWHTDVKIGMDYLLVIIILGSLPAYLFCY